MTYQVGRDQYVATMMNGNRAIDLGGTVLAFKLDGNLDLPISDIVQATVPELPDGDFGVDQISEGDDIYHAQCASCHGGIGIPNEVAIVAPDLRLMTLSTHDEMSDIVIGGSRADRGMPEFRDAITSDQLESIRAFVVEQARRLKEFQEQNQEAVESAANEEALDRA